MVIFRFAEVDPQCAAARACLRQYYAELDAAFAGGFRVELSCDPNADQLRPPNGSFVVATRGADSVGCIAIKRAGPDWHELKRMWVAPAERGSGLARKLMSEAERIARSLGAAYLRLDTNRALPEAIAIYHHWGWREIGRFNDDPYAEVFFEKWF